jgi:hypothetical protein
MPDKSLFVCGNDTRIEIGVTGEFTLSLSVLDAAWLAEQLIEALRYVTEEPTEPPVPYRILN